MIRDFDFQQDNAEYVELLEDKKTYEARKIALKEKEEAERKRKRETDPESLTDWFLVGTVDILTQNIAKVANIRDKNRIRAKIDFLNAEAKKKRDLTRKEKANGDLEKIRLKLWKYQYMVKKDQPKLKESLGLDPKCTYEALFEHAEFDIDGEECDLEGYEELKQTDEWIEQGM